MSCLQCDVMKGKLNVSVYHKRQFQPIINLTLQCANAFRFREILLHGTCGQLLLTACIDRDALCDLRQIHGVLDEANVYILHPTLYLTKKLLIKFILLQETYILIHELMVCGGVTFTLFEFLRNLLC